MLKAYNLLNEQPPAFPD